MNNENIQIKCSYAKLVNESDLVDHPRNPQKHSREQIEHIKRILKFQGVRHPIIVSTLSNRIMAGHGRRMAFRELGMVQVPVDFQHFDTEAQEYAFIVSDNALQQEYAELDRTMINDDLIDLGPELDPDMLGMKEFQITPDYSDKVETEKPEKKEQIKFCPSCGYEF